MTFRSDDGVTGTVEVWSVGGRLCQRVYASDGTHHFESLRRRESIFRIDKTQCRPYIVCEVPSPFDGPAKLLLVRAYNDPKKDGKRNRVENLRMIPPGDPDFVRLYPRKSDAESINNGIDDDLPRRRARSYTVEGELLDFIGYLRMRNSLARFLYGSTRRDLAEVA